MSGSGGWMVALGRVTHALNRVLILLAGLLVCYVILTQLVKIWFYRKFSA